MKTSIHGKNPAAGGVKSLAVSAALAFAGTALASTDYSPALWVPCCNANWYTSGYGHKFCVIHDMEGYYGSTISYLTSCSHTSSSVYYAVNGLTDSSDNGAPPGEITQMVRESYYAWHAICWNQYAFGTEHEGFQSNPAWYTSEMYQASAGLQAHLCSAYGIAKDRNHIVAHGEKSNANWVAYARGAFGIDPNCNTHTDPGPYWNWSQFMTLINPPSSVPLQPAAGYSWVAQHANGALEVFARGDDNAIWHNYQTPGQGSGWSGWYSMGGSFAATPSVGRSTNGNLEVFAIDSATTYVYHNWQTPGQGNGWYGWASFGGIGCDGTPAVAQNANGRLEIFVRGHDGVLYHNWQLAAGGWNGWASLGGNIKTSPVVSRNSGDGHLEVFAVDNSTTHLLHIVQTPGVGSGWTGWSDFGSIGCDFSPAVGMNTNGNLEAFVRGHDGALYHIYQTPGQGNGWSAWGNLGGNFAAGPAVQNNQAGNLEVYAIDQSTVVNHIYQTPGQGSGWSAWGTLSGIGVDGTIGVGRKLDGTEEIFTRGHDATMYHNYQTPGVGNGWRGWTAMTGASFPAPNN